MVESQLYCVVKGFTPVWESGLHHEAVGGSGEWLSTGCFVCNQLKSKLNLFKQKRGFGRDLE